MSTRTICENCRHEFSDHNFSTPDGYQHQCLRPYCICPDWKPKQVPAAPKPPRARSSLKGLPTREQWQEARHMLTRIVGWYPNIDDTPGRYGPQTQGSLIQKARRLLRETDEKAEPAEDKASV